MHRKGQVDSELVNYQEKITDTQLSNDSQINCDGIAIRSSFKASGCAEGQGAG